MPLPEFTAPRVIPASRHYVEPYAVGSGTYIGDGERGVRPPNHPGELGGTARVSRDAVICVAMRCRVPTFAAIAVLARRLAVSKAAVRRFTQEGIEAPPLRSAILDVTESIERRAGGPWAGHVPAALRTVINTEGT